MPTHAEQRLIAYTPEQLFDLVADVGKYPQFLPWCVKAIVKSRTETELVADLTIGFGPFRETFTSRVTLERPSCIRVSYEKGPFRYLNNVWTFTPILADVWSISSLILNSVLACCRTRLGLCSMKEYA